MCRAVQVLSVSRVGECINVEIGTEEDVVVAVPNEVGQMVQQIIHAIYSGIKKRVTKATICLTEEEYEKLKPAVGDEADIQVTQDRKSTRLNSSHAD